MPTLSYQLPTGAIIDYGGGSAPGGFLLCDGSAVSRTTYASLFAAIGTAFGVGDGSTTFNVPDARGRATIGVGTGSGLTARTLGATAGAEAVNLQHSHTVNSHNHEVTSGANVYGSGGASGGMGVTPAVLAAGQDSLAANIGDGSTTFNVPGDLYTSNTSPGTNSQLSTAQSVMQPSIAFNKIIKT